MWVSHPGLQRIVSGDSPPTNYNLPMGIPQNSQLPIVHPAVICYNIGKSLILDVYNK